MADYILCGGNSSRYEYPKLSKGHKMKTIVECIKANTGELCQKDCPVKCYLTCEKWREWREKVDNE
jgi:hypothetical protein